MNQKRSVLIHQRPIMFTPDLARIIGVNAAIVLQHLEFLLDIPKNGKEIDGHRWIFNTYKDWQSDHFPFWSQDTIMRIFQYLKKSAMIDFIQPEGRDSRQKYYRVTEAGISFLTTKILPPLPADTDILSGSDDVDILSVSEADNMSASCASASNISSSSTTSSTIKGVFPVPEILRLKDGFVEEWGNYLNYRKDRKKPITEYAKKLLLKKLQIHPDKAIDGLQHAMISGWTGFQWDWIKGQSDNSIPESSPHDDIPEDACTESVHGLKR